MIAGHLLLLLLVLSQHQARTIAVKSDAFQILSLAAPVPAAAKPPPPVMPSKLPEKIKPLSDPALLTDAESQTAAATPGNCATLAVVSAAILADQPAVDAVHQAPPETRSISEAIIIWSGGWPATAMTPDAPLGAVRLVIEQSLRGVGDGCLDEQVVGPRLVGVPAGERMMFLVFGSGQWSWRQLLQPDGNAEPPLPNSTTDSVQAPAPIAF